MRQNWTNVIDQATGDPIEALAAWFDPSRTGAGLSVIKTYLLLAAHGALNIGAAFLFWPVALAVCELWWRRRSAGVPSRFAWTRTRRSTSCPARRSPGWGRPPTSRQSALFPSIYGD